MALRLQINTKDSVSPCHPRVSLGWAAVTEPGPLPLGSIRALTPERVHILLACGGNLNWGLQLWQDTQKSPLLPSFPRWLLLLLQWNFPSLVLQDSVTAFPTLMYCSFFLTSKLLAINSMDSVSDYLNWSAVLPLAVYVTLAKWLNLSVSVCATVKSYIIKG